MHRGLWTHSETDDGRCPAALLTPAHPAWCVCGHPGCSDPARPVEAALNAQGILQPGQPGYWKVWGAQASDIRPGDLVMVKYEDTGIREYEVAELAPRGGSNLLDVVRPRFLSTAGDLFTVGALQPVEVLRKDIQNRLAPSI